MPSRKAAESAHLIFAHGAGADKDHPWMVAMDHALADVGIGATRYNFPFIEGRRRAPDKPAVATARVREEVVAANKRHARTPLLVGGKSFGGRMSAYAQAEAPLPRVSGLVFFGFPLHPPKKPSIKRAEPLERIEIPMLFLQGTKDALAEYDLISEVCRKLGKHATLVEIPNANHGFAVPKRSGMTDADVQSLMAAAVRTWFDKKVRGA